MKKLKLFALLSLGFMALGGIVLGTAHKSYAPVVAEPDSSEPAPESSEEPAESSEPVEEPEEVYECKVVIGSAEHGKIKLDKKEGHVGDLVTINADADLFYLVQNVSVNGTDLIEDEETAGKFVFALVEGENIITAKFVIDEELLGKMSTMVEQASNKDWTNLFSLKNVITLVSCLLNGGLLIAIVKYYIKDKKLTETIKTEVNKTVAAVLPEATKNIIVEALKNLLAPYFSQIQSGVVDIQEVCVVLCRCFALAQENTPEARIAITKELASLKLSDKASIAVIEAKIQEFIKNEGDKMADILTQLSNIEKSNKQIVEEVEPETIPEDNGTQI